MKKIGLVATPKEWSVIEDFIERIPPDWKSQAYIASLMTWNYACSAHEAEVDDEMLKEILQIHVNNIGSAGWDDNPEMYDRVLNQLKRFEETE